MASRLPTPPPSSSPPLPPDMPVAQNASLPGRINAATRKSHIELNRLIMQRLPLALPPHTDTTLLFSQGILPFARIFYLFETEWESLTHHFFQDPRASSEHQYDLRLWLATLRPHGLARSSRFKNDMKHLGRVGGSSMYDATATDDGWVKGMRDLIRTRPHVLIAFAWVFYMAVFSGGRWIRQQLANSGVEFWARQDSTLPMEKAQSPSTLALPGITFLSFDGQQDGEDLKALFKTRLADAEWLLDNQEKQDVTDVAEQLFQHSIWLVNELDRMVLRRKILSWTWPILGTILFLTALFSASSLPGRFSRTLF